MRGLFRGWQERGWGWGSERSGKDGLVPPPTPGGGEWGVPGVETPQGYKTAKTESEKKRKGGRARGPETLFPPPHLAGLADDHGAEQLAAQPRAAAGGHVLLDDRDLGVGRELRELVGAGQAGGAGAGDDHLSFGGGRGRRRRGGVGGLGGGGAACAGVGVRVGWGLRWGFSAAGSGVEFAHGDLGEVWFVAAVMAPTKPANPGAALRFGRARARQQPQTPNSKRSKPHQPQARIRNVSKQPHSRQPRRRCPCP